MPERGTDVVVGPTSRRTAARTPRRCSAAWRCVPRQHVSYRGATFEEMDVDAVLARGAEVALVDELAHTNVPGSRNAKRWQDIQELLAAGITVITNAQRPAPGVDQRRRAADHRRPAARDRAGRAGPPGRADRAGRHGAGGAAPPDGPRQHLPAGEGRRRAGQLLPGRQPHRAARAGPHLAGRQGRRRARPLSRAARDLGDLGGPGARRRRADRRSGGRHADPPGRADRRPGQGSRAPGRARHPQRRAGREQPGRPGPPAHARREPGRHLPPGGRRRRRVGVARLRARRERDRARARGEPSRPADPGALLRGRADRDAGVRRHRRPPGHARGGAARPPAGPRGRGARGDRGRRPGSPWRWSACRC